MKRGLSLWESLNMPIRWPRHPSAEEARRAHELLRRHASQSRKAHAEKKRLLAELERASANHDIVRLRRCAGELARVVRTLSLLEELARCESNETNRFVFSSWMLRNSFRYCTARPEEGMHFILGVEHEGFALGTTAVPFVYAHRSIAGAAGEHSATHRIGIEAHESGHRILALVHSHPGRGMQANRHSATDAATQRLWERTTRMIGGIWSRDGYLRWYSDKLAFEVQILGNHLKRVSNDVWKLQLEDTLEERRLPAPHAAHVGV